MTCCSFLHFLNTMYPIKEKIAMTPTITTTMMISLVMFVSLVFGTTLYCYSSSTVLLLLMNVGFVLLVVVFVFPPLLLTLLSLVGGGELSMLQIVTGSPCVSASKIFVPKTLASYPLLIIVLSLSLTVATTFVTSTLALSVAGVITKATFVEPDHTQTILIVDAWILSTSARLLINDVVPPLAKN